MGMSILAFLVLLKILSKRVKKLHWIGAMGPILACAIGIAAVAAGGLQKRGIKIVEKIPQGAVVDRTGRKGKYRGELAVWGLFRKHRTAGGEALSCWGACTEGAALKAPIHPVSQLSLPRPSCLLISQAPSFRCCCRCPCCCPLATVPPPPDAPYAVFIGCCLQAFLPPPSTGGCPSRTLAA